MSFKERLTNAEVSLLILYLEITLQYQRQHQNLPTRNTNIQTNQISLRKSIQLQKCRYQKNSHHLIVTHPRRTVILSQVLEKDTSHTIETKTQEYSSS